MKQEKEEVHSLPFFGIPKLLPFIKKYHKRILVMVLMGLVASLFEAAAPLFNRYAIDHFVADNTLEGLPAFIALYVGLLLVYVVDNFFGLDLRPGGNERRPGSAK